ncbi:MAG TPA: hypothetical protein VGT08_15540 [Terracidiphilus sp.]|nr:hypothetical protein [Terracidiphilus sp.]
MNKAERFVVCALFFVVTLWAPASSFAQNPFDGTWRVNFSQSKLSPKPNVFYLSQGWYHCVSCNPAFDVKADGEDQAVTGQNYDTISVREVDAKSTASVTKKGGAIESEQTRTVSSDGKTLTVKTIGHPAGGGPVVTTEVTATRVGIAPSGVHATSGSWKISKIQQSDNGLLTTFKTNGDELTMSTPTGETYTAKLDGNDYPAKGAYSYDSVSLKRIDKNTIEETDKKNGAAVHVLKMSVSSDGKKMTVVETNKVTDRTSTYIAVKQ